MYTTLSHIIFYYFLSKWLSATDRYNVGVICAKSFQIYLMNYKVTERTLNTEWPWPFRYAAGSCILHMVLMCLTFLSIYFKILVWHGYSPSKKWTDWPNYMVLPVFSTKLRLWEIVNKHGQVVFWLLNTVLSIRSSIHSFEYQTYMLNGF